MKRPKGAIRPSGFWIPAKLEAAREYYDAAQEGHIYVYSQSPYWAHPVVLDVQKALATSVTNCKQGGSIRDCSNKEFDGRDSLAAADTASLDELPLQE